MASSVMVIGCGTHGKVPAAADRHHRHSGDRGASMPPARRRPICTPPIVITDQQYEAFLVKLKVVYQQAHRLGDALTAYNAAAGPDTASQVKAALDALSVLVPDLVAQVGGPGGAKIAELVSQVNQLILNIAAGLSPQARLVALEPEVILG